MKALTDQAHQLEVDRYIEAMRCVRIESDDLPTSLWGFKRDVLQLARHAWPSEAFAWYEQAEFLASVEEVERLEKEIRDYRTVVLGESLLGGGGHSDAASLTFLFSMLFHFPIAGEMTSGSYLSLCQFIDEFAIEFIEHFGSAEDVLNALRHHFRISTV